MFARRDRAKADATRTPLADLAPDIPQRSEHENASNEETTSATTDETPPKTLAMEPLETTETNTAPANVRSRPSARKIGTRSGVPLSIPRTIAEMQSGVTQTTVIETDVLEAEEAAAEEDLPPELFISRELLLITTLVPFAILTILPALLGLAVHGVGFSNSVRFAVDFAATALCSIGAFALLIRNWRLAFHDTPTELRPRTVLELWEQRASGVRRDGWVTGSLAIIGGFLVMLLLSLVFLPASYGLSATYLLPYVLIQIIAKGIGAVLFVGYLQRGLRALQSPMRSTVATGLLYGISLAVVNTVTIAVNDPSSITGLAIPFVLVSLAVAFAAAWIRYRSRSLIAAVCFQLLLILLGIRV